jgi:hypothetical protein
MTINERAARKAALTKFLDFADLVHAGQPASVNDYADVIAATAAYIRSERERFAKAARTMSPARIAANKKRAKLPRRRLKAACSGDVITEPQS